jgi:hypothetical protein
MDKYKNQEFLNMAEEVKESFPSEYVKELRAENAEWRTKYRGLEERVLQAEVRSELKERGIKADPSWVKIEKDQSIGEAIDSFIESYPHLAIQKQESSKEDFTLKTKVEPKTKTKPIAPEHKKDSNVPGPSAGGLMKGKDLTEIKKDSKARGQLRDLYQNLLVNASYQQNEE